MGNQLVQVSPGRVRKKDLGKGPEKILLVDDDIEFRSEFKELLDGYSVIEASGGEEAIRIFKKPNEIELVILDVKMPGLSGTDILKQIKEIDPEIKVIMLTGYSSKDTAVEALRGRADDYIEKPVDEEAVRRMIARLLDEKTGNVYGESLDSNGKMERVKRFLERNCFKKVTLSDAAQTVYMSPKYLSNLFKRVTGKSFNEYKLGIKMEKVGEMLRNTGCTICEISNKMGFQNPESFMRIFKKINGLTPTEYREKVHSRAERDSRRKNKHGRRNKHER